MCEIYFGVCDEVRRFLSLSGSTKRDRLQATAEVSEAIAAVGGWIINHTLFSNLAIAIQFSIPPQGLDDWQRRLAEAEVLLDDESLAKIGWMNDGGPIRGDEIGASVNITFLHNEPDLRREVPSVPG